MKLLISSHYFAPRLGGIETMTLLLARAFTGRGHTVRILTTTPGLPTDAPGLEVLRQPGPAELRRAVAWSDLVFHNNISLNLCWPLLLHPRPWVVTTQTWIARPDGSLGWRERLKKQMLKRAHNVAISRAIAATLPVSATLVPNCYDETVFKPGDKPPAKDMIFVGRLVSDKGADLALDALARLHRKGQHRHLTIVGDGPEKTSLVTRAHALGLRKHVEFPGPLQGIALADELRAHRVQLVPSRWPEPFGIVALEGAACGCFVIGSNQGGLPEAIGPCGVCFPNGDADALAERIAQVAPSPHTVVQETARRAHLEKHTTAFITERYLEIFNRAVGMKNRSA